MKNDIDKKLRAWAVAQRTAPAHAAKLTAAIMQSWRAQPATLTPRTTLMRPVIWGVAAAIAASLIAIALLRPPAASPSLDTVIAAEQASFDRESLRLGRLYHEAAALFGEQLHWVAQSGSATEIGIGDAPPQNDALSLRFTLVARDKDNGAWRRLWSADLVACGDEYIEVSPGANSGTTIQLWVHLLNDKQAFVESQLRLATLHPLKATTSEVLSFGKVSTAARLTDNNTEYLLLQTATPIGDTPCNS